MPFGEYGIAMERKLWMADYHLNRLDEMLEGCSHSAEHQLHDDLPTICVQAELEACGRALAAIPDQLGSGLADLLRGQIPCMPGVNGAYLHRVVPKLPTGWQLTDKLIPYLDPRYDDLRDWRNRHTHRFDVKRSGGRSWFLEGDPGRAYVQGSVSTYLSTTMGWIGELVGRAGEFERLADGGLRSLPSGQDTHGR